MPEFCTCGAQLPPDALFCHKCGKPQRELVEPEIAPVVYLPDPAVVVEPRVEAPPLSFRNPVAVKIGVLVALAATALFFLPLINWFGAGFFAVLFYRRRTGLLLNVESGLRMGWITGLIMFAIMAVLLAISVMALRALGGVTMLPAEFKSAFDPKVLESLKSLQSAPAILAQLLNMFVFVNGLSMAGGALGAKVLGRR